MKVREVKSIEYRMIRMYFRSNIRFSYEPIMLSLSVDIIDSGMGEMGVRFNRRDKFIADVDDCYYKMSQSPDQCRDILGRSWQYLAYLDVHNLTVCRNIATIYRQEWMRIIPFICQFPRLTQKTLAVIN